MENMENKNTELEQGLFSDNAVVAGQDHGDLAPEFASTDAADFKFDIAVNPDGQLSLFGMDPETSAKEEEEKKGKSAASTKSIAKAGKGAAPKTPPAPPKLKLEKVPLNEPDSWSVRYGGQTFIINTLFEEEIADGKTEATLDEIREKLATDEGCVELTQARAKWDTEKEEEKLLFLDAFGTSKGCF
ncbi:hypothetical protein M5X11_12450 [Paenibacillus alginolyticus]|uniref:hypothetical protein n=1 Tax=Paenibacillus alginolyticus TaxID=59839 RepID=UPI000401DE8C|nr:hypothetical protein [Paenibacillus alginolyticus]MCY9665766.1 hypothetical protein [Paenibacillus alginolyticus]